MPVPATPQTAVVHKLLRMCTPKAFNSKRSMKTLSSIEISKHSEMLGLYRIYPRAELVVLIQNFGHNIERCLGSHPSRWNFYKSLQNFDLKQEVCYSLQLFLAKNCPHRQKVTGSQFHELKSPSRTPQIFEQCQNFFYIKRYSNLSLSGTETLKGQLCTPKWYILYP